MVAFKQRYLEGDEDADSIASPSVSGRSDNEDASEIQKDNEELIYDAVFGISYQCVSCFSHEIWSVKNVIEKGTNKYGTYIVKGGTEDNSKFGIQIQLYIPA